MWELSLGRGSICGTVLYDGKRTLCSLNGKLLRAWVVTQLVDDGRVGRTGSGTLLHKKTELKGKIEDQSSNTIKPFCEGETRWRAKGNFS